MLLAKGAISRFIRPALPTSISYSVVHRGNTSNYQRQHWADSLLLPPCCSLVCWLALWRSLWASPSHAQRR